MTWNWQLPDWPHFKYDRESVIPREKTFLMGVGSTIAYLNTIKSQDYHQFVVEILSTEGLESSRIEGEVLDRASLQFSIQQHFGLNVLTRESDRESRMATLLCDVYETYQQPFTHEHLAQWHDTLFEDQVRMQDRGKYRTHSDPMQIVSRRYGDTRVFFEAPPSARVFHEMSSFLHWLNFASLSEPILARAAIAHVYFESIHPFEDGNGRIGRLIVEKVLSQGVGRPVLIAVSRILEKRKNEYYAALEKCNRTIEIDHWVDFFSEVIMQAQADSLQLIYFLIEKSKMFTRLAGQLNSRQEKILLRMFAEGPTGFKGGLSAENYVSITKTSRATATRDLTELVHQGALKKTGDLRHTRYWLNVQFE
jgi:Fic family protein